MHDPASPDPGSTPSPAWIALSMLVVLMPLTIGMVVAMSLQLDALAFVGGIASFVLAWLLLRMRGRAWADLGLNRQVSLRRLLVTVPLATVALMLVSGVTLYFLGEVGLSPNLERFEALRGNIIALLVGLAIVWTVAAFGEEMLFRGFVLHSFLELLRPRVGVPWAWALALLATSVLFGVMHAYQGLAGMIGTGIVGFGLGVVSLSARRNLWPCILTHGLYDTVGFVLVYLSVNQNMSAI